MPGETRQCFLCGRFNRAVRSLLMTIDCAEQERRIRSGYLRRHKREIIGPVMSMVVHRNCYRSIVQREPLAMTRSNSNPRKYSCHRKNKHSQSRDSNPSTCSSDQGVVPVPMNDPSISVEESVLQRTCMISSGDVHANANANANVRVQPTRLESHHDQEVCTERG